MDSNRFDNRRFHNDGPIGERDYEDGGDYYAPVKADSSARDAKRKALAAELTAKAEAHTGQSPLPFFHREIIRKHVERTIL